MLRISRSEGSGQFSYQFASTRKWNRQFRIGRIERCDYTLDLHNCNEYCTLPKRVGAPNKIPSLQSKTYSRLWNPLIQDEIETYTYACVNSAAVITGTSGGAGAFILARTKYIFVRSWKKLTAKDAFLYSYSPALKFLQHEISCILLNRLLQLLLS